MKKIIIVAVLLLICCKTEKLFALDLDSDTSFGSLSFVEGLSADGDFKNRRRRDADRTTVWNFDYVLTSTKTLDPTSGNTVKDDTSEFDGGLGVNKKDDFEYGLGLTYATTPQESLRDYGPNIYYGFTTLLGQKSESFTPDASIKFTLSQLTYIQAFSSSFTSRTGKLKPTTGTSAISQVFPKVEANFDVTETFSLKLAYTYYFYNRNVNDFLQTLDSPRAVAVGLGNLSSSVSGFNTDSKEIEFTILPIDLWEIDLQGTEATSAIDSSPGWTGKAGALYDFTKNWRAGVSFQYETNELLTDNIYTLSVKYASE
jgi:hypothetical protein